LDVSLAPDTWGMMGAGSFLAMRWSQLRSLNHLCFLMSSAPAFKHP